MLNLLIKSYRKLIGDLSRAQLDQHQLDSEKSDDESKEIEPEALENNCGHFFIYFREDGEFAVASDFTRHDDEVIDISALLLHMINSGNLAEYFVKSLKVWAEGDVDKETFAKEVIKEWKKLFYTKNEDSDILLAVDPSDVFGLKRMK
mgnify:CR=1 FL=1|tara:strand:+ start:4254 stop:4697 length:444 start_codon:yes stop_codon:yes gene_type:complete